MFRRVSLANKCLLLFGAAVVLIVLAALTVPLYRMTSEVDERGREIGRRMIGVYEASRGGVGVGVTGADFVESAAATAVDGGTIETLSAARVAEIRKDRPELAEAWDTLASNAKLTEYSAARNVGLVRDYVHARPIRRVVVPGNGGLVGGSERTGTAAGGKAASAEALVGITFLRRSSTDAVRELLVNAAYLGSAAFVALGLAVLTFYLITTRLILSPVRALRDTAEEVRRGNLDIRSDIQTGDEFEELADAFNGMLSGLNQNDSKLRAINAALDNRVIDLQSQNSSLEAANKVKGEFLANVSHELRTPLNSILGFADLLIEAADREVSAGDDSSRLLKRKRYVENIQSSGRTLLDLINGLLEIAKVEAGKVDISIDRVELKEFGEALLALMRPMADKRGVELRIEIGPDVPAIETDANKLQQIVYNLLSNAVKFTGDVAEQRAEMIMQMEARAASEAPGTVMPSVALPPVPLVTLRIEGLMARVAGGAAAQSKVRICVLDTGPGIAPEHREVIFEKFTQISRGLSRKHAGTGLGLAICKELTALLQGELSVDSEIGRGSMFSVILPEKLDPARVAETKLEARFRVSLGQKSGQGTAQRAGQQNGTQGAGPDGGASAEKQAGNEAGSR